jgi:hypothetical protein
MICEVGKVTAKVGGEGGNADFLYYLQVKGRGDDITTCRSDHGRRDKCVKSA